MTVRRQNKVTVAVHEDQYVNTFILSGACADLSKTTDLSFLVPSDLSLAGKIEDLYPNSTVVVYQPSRSNRRNHRRILNLLTWRYRSRSSSFRYRLERRHIFPNFLKLLRERGLRVAVGSVILWLGRVSLDAFTHNWIVFYPYFRYLRSRLKTNASLENALDFLSPDMVLCPVAAFDHDPFDFLGACDLRQIPTLFLVDNWDNVSSKSVYWKKPTYLGVWGEQSRQDAVRIHGFDQEKVFNIGTPRFERHFERRAVRNSSPFDFPYILFVGTALEYNELECLELAAEIVRNNPAIFKDVRIVYRPHPFRQAAWDPRVEAIEEVLVDPQFIALQSAVKSGSPRLPDLDYFPGLLANSEVVIGGLTSMLIEASIYGKKYIALAHDDGVNFTNQLNAYRSYEHFKGLENFTPVTLVIDLNQLSPTLLSVWASRHVVPADYWDHERQFFLFFDQQSYSSRLNNRVLELLDMNT